MKYDDDDILSSTSGVKEVFQKGNKPRAFDVVISCLVLIPNVEQRWIRYRILRCCLFPQFFVLRVSASKSADPAVKVVAPICLRWTGKSIGPQVCRTEWHAERFPWQVEFTAVPISLFLLPHHRLHIVYTHIPDTVQTVYELPLLPNNTAVKHFYTNRSGSKS